MDDAGLGRVLTDAGAALALGAEAHDVAGDLDGARGGGNEVREVALGLGDEAGDVGRVDGGVVLEEVAVVDAAEDGAALGPREEHEELAGLGVSREVRLLEGDLVGEVVFDNEHVAADGDQLRVAAVGEEVVLQAGAVDDEVGGGAGSAGGGGERRAEGLFQRAQGLAADGDAPAAQLREQVDEVERGGDGVGREDKEVLHVREARVCAQVAVAVHGVLVPGLVEAGRGVARRDDVAVVERVRLHERLRNRGELAQLAVGGERPVLVLLCVGGHPVGAGLGRRVEHGAVAGEVLGHERDVDAVAEPVVQLERCGEADDACADHEYLFLGHGWVCWVAWLTLLGCLVAWLHACVHAGPSGAPPPYVPRPEWPPRPCDRKHPPETGQVSARRGGGRKRKETRSGAPTRRRAGRGPAHQRQTSPVCAAGPTFSRTRAPPHAATNRASGTTSGALENRQRRPVACTVGAFPVFRQVWQQHTLSTTRVRRPDELGVPGTVAAEPAPAQAVGEPAK